MKIQAKDVKVGMTITWGVVTVTVKRIENGVQKNGKETVSFYGDGVRSMGRGYDKRALKNYDFTMKADSFTKAK
tara:strand:- start:355 stop:576 length:222 start_codon:yes stop_codon:yes gene_type:complete